MNQMINITDGPAAATLRNRETNSALLLDWSYDAYDFNYKNTGWISLGSDLRDDVMANTDKMTELKKLIFAAINKYQNDPSKRLVVDKLNDYLNFII